MTSTANLSANDLSRLVDEPKAPNTEVTAYQLPRRAKPLQKWRLAMVAGIFMAAFGLIGAKLVLTAIPGGVQSASASAHRDGPITTAPEYAARAPIHDREGQILAYSLPMQSLYANPQEIRQVASIVTDLQSILPEIDPLALTINLSDTARRFIYVRRHLTPDEFDKVRRLGIPGLDFQREYRRIYPQGRLTAHVVGMTKRDHTGLSGIELFLESELANTHDVPLELTIDVRVQHVVREALAAAIDRFDAKGGLGQVMNVHTGELLAMVSLPDFDPNRPDSVQEGAEFNQAVRGRYELGSMFKLITAATALDTGAASEISRFDASKPLEIDGHTIRDFRGEWRVLTMGEVLVHSSNIGAALIAQKIGKDRLLDYFSRFGLLSQPAIELDEAVGPLLPYRWSDATVATVAFGHGLSVTPVQFLAAIAAVANGGVLHRPTLLKVPANAELIGRRVITEATAKRMRPLMRAVVVEGSGKLADSRYYWVGGKTGTAQKVVNGRYNASKRLSSFVGVFPMEAPRYAVMISVDEPKGRGDTLGLATGGWVAAPAVGEIVDRIGPMLGVPLAKPDELTVAHLPPKRR